MFQGHPGSQKGYKHYLKPAKTEKQFTSMDVTFFAHLSFYSSRGSQLQSTYPSQGEVSPYYTVILHVLESPSYVFDIIQIITQPAFPGDFMYNQK